VTSLYFAIPLAFNGPRRRGSGLPWDDLSKILHERQRMAKLQTGGKIAARVNSLCKHRTVDARTLQTTGGFAIAKTRT